MEYLSAFFHATRSVLDLHRRKDPVLIRLFLGIIGVPEDVPADAIQLRAEFAAFAARELKRGPLRKDDVLKIARMVRFQQTKECALTEYDVETDTQWEWDSNPLVMVVVCELACEAAIQLEDQELYSDCASLLWHSLRCIENRDFPGSSPFKKLASESAADIARRLDVDAHLRAFDAAMPEVKHGG
jgi:hypothetical protein